MPDAAESLRIIDLSFSHFRNYDQFSLNSLGNLTIFVGKNGVGKTNVLEGIQLLTSASSFRHPHVSQLIRENFNDARISADMSDGNRLVTTELLMEPGKRKYLVNGKAKGIVDIRGTLPAVVFTPDDLQLAKKSSSVKRNALDDLGVQLTRNYYIVRRDYEKTVRYKNRLLKEEASRALVESINETLITCGSQLYCYRRTLFDRLIPLVQQNYAAIIGDESIERPDEGFTAVYRPSWLQFGHVDDRQQFEVEQIPVDYEQQPTNDSHGVKNSQQQNDERLPVVDIQQTDKHLGGVDYEQQISHQTSVVHSQQFNEHHTGVDNKQHSLSRAEVKEIMAEQLQQVYAEERARKRSLIGPHNDKIEFLLSGRDASDFASQGQQRSIVLAWKLAEVELTRQSLGVSPVLLLDDVMSELDATRRDMLVRFVTDDIQTFITATDLSAFNAPLLDRAQIIQLG